MPLDETSVADEISITLTPGLEAKAPQHKESENEEATIQRNSQ
jgi:hypothetical protein